eukprot:scaffold2683_cov50-Cyclotella_meneghiniana.AAC.2
MNTIDVSAAVRNTARGADMIRRRCFENEIMMQSATVFSEYSEFRIRLSYIRLYLAKDERSHDSDNWMERIMG